MNRIEKGYGLSAAAGCSFEESQCQQEPEVSRALGVLMGELERYENLAQRINDRISSVVAPDCPRPDPGGKLESYQTALAQTVFEFRCKVKRTNDAMESLYQRIEL